MKIGAGSSKSGGTTSAKKLPVKVSNGLFVVPKSARATAVRTSQETTCPFCMFATAEFAITKNGAPSIYCPRCRTRVFCQSLNSEIVVRAVCRAMREVDGLAEQLTALYANFIEPIPED